VGKTVLRVMPPGRAAVKTAANATGKVIASRVPSLFQGGTNDCEICRRKERIPSDRRIASLEIWGGKKLDLIDGMSDSRCMAETIFGGP